MKLFVVEIRRLYLGERPNFLSPFPVFWVCPSKFWGTVRDLIRSVHTICAQELTQWILSIVSPYLLQTRISRLSLTSSDSDGQSHASWPNFRQHEQIHDFMSSAVSTLKEYS
jgi:hypothetical protein